MFIVEKIAYCPFYKVLPIDEALENTITNFKGLGGYEVLGKCRRGGPVVAEDLNIKSIEKQEKQKERRTKKSSAQMTIDEIKRELDMPLFTDTDNEFKTKMQEYITKNKMDSMNLSSNKNQ